MNRFVLPVLPIALMFSGYSLTVLEMPDLSMGVKNRASSSHTKWPSKLRLAVVFLVATNIPMALYMSLVHQVWYSAPSTLWIFMGLSLSMDFLWNKLNACVL